MLAGKRSWGHREPAQHRHQGGVAKDDDGHGQGHRPVGTRHQVHDGDDGDGDGDGGGDHDNEGSRSPSLQQFLVSQTGQR